MRSQNDTCTRRRRQTAKIRAPERPVFQPLAHTCPDSCNRPLRPIVLRIRTIYRARKTTMTGHELALALRGAYLAMHRRTDNALESAGVTADQFVVLSELTQGASKTQRE